MDRNKIKITVLTLTAFFFVGIFILGFKRSGDDVRDDFTYFMDQFASPDKEYGSTPFFVWNTKVTRSDIDSMLVSFKKNAFGGVFIHARAGLITEYLSEEWYELCEYTVKKGKELDLNIWLYDENSYPSGFAGGHVQDQMPESYNQGQMLNMVKTTKLPENVGSFFICLKEENGVFRDITDHLDNEKDNIGLYYLFNKQYNPANPFYGGFPYVDLLVEGVTGKFLEIAVDGYEENLGKEFGKTVPGIFSDEMTLRAMKGESIRWTPELFRVFENRWGYDLSVNLPCLFENVGNWRKVRHNYFQTLLDMLIDRWAKPYSLHVEKKGLASVCNYFEHTWPSPYNIPDNMAMYAWHHIPGIDMLFNEYNEKGVGNGRETQFGNIRAVKEAVSVANQLNKKRVLSESYGGAGWDMTFKDMKRLGDWEYALGINFLCQHMSMMSIHGSRKTDYPGSFSYQNPWYPYYGELNSYYARLSFALSQGKQINDVLVLQPTTSAWMYAVPPPTAFSEPNDEMMKIGEKFVSFVKTLEKNQAEYDIGSENIIKDHGSVTDNKFIVGQRTYTTVVIPPGMENIDYATLKLLEKYISNNGKLLQFDDLKYVDGERDDELKHFNLAKGTKRLTSYGKDVIHKHFLGPYPAISLQSDTANGNLYHHRRILNSGQLIFLTNADMQDSANGKIKLQNQDVLLLDPFTGKVWDYPEYRDEEGKYINFDIPPAGSLLLFISDKKRSEYPQWSEPRLEQKLKSETALNIQRTMRNVLPIDFCDLYIGDEILKDQFFFNAADSVYKFHGIKKGNPWDHTVQFKRKTLDRDTFERGSGFEAVYNFNIALGTDLKNLKAVVEQAHLYENILVNGIALKPEPGKWWLDKNFAVIDIGQHIKEGINSLKIIANPMKVLAEIQPIYILGDFNVLPAEKGWILSSATPLDLGSWKSQGMPMYAEGVTYTKKYKISSDKKYLLKLYEWKGTIAIVIINGKEIGTIGYPPYMLDISPFLRNGENRIAVKVIGSLRNLLGPHHNNPPSGYAAPALFRKTNGYYPSGEGYATLDYGLMEDFDLFIYNN